MGVQAGDTQNQYFYNGSASGGIGARRRRQVEAGRHPGQAVQRPRRDPLMALTITRN
jgi:hypothetical protein